MPSVNIIELRNTQLLPKKSLASVSSEIGAACCARVMDVHALVDTAWNQAASEPTAESGDEKSRHVGDQAGSFVGPRVDFAAARRTDGVSRMWTEWNYSCYDVLCCEYRLLRSQWCCCVDTIDGLCVARRSLWWRNEA
jgi:hypothetical protein